MKVINFSSAELIQAFATDVAQTINFSLQKNIVYLYLSGGSIVKSYDIILQKLNVTLDKLQIAQVDERYGSDPLHENSNQKLIFEQTNMIKYLKPLGVKFRFILNGKDAAEETSAFERFVTRALDSERVVNIALLGIGEDAHIAGIKPDKDVKEHAKLFNSDNNIALYDAPDYKNRITLTFSALKKMDYAFVMLSGEQKREALTVVTDEKAEFSLNKYPAQILREMENVKIYTDIG